MPMSDNITSFDRFTKSGSATLTANGFSIVRREHVLDVVITLPNGRAFAGGLDPENRASGARTITRSSPASRAYRPIDQSRPLY